MLDRIAKSRPSTLQFKMETQVSKTHGSNNDKMAVAGQFLRAHRTDDVRLVGQKKIQVRARGSGNMCTDRTK